MNQLKQNLNDGLNELELTLAMEAEILMNAETPTRKVRFRSRAVIAALLAICMVSITAVAAVISSNWKVFTDPNNIRLVHAIPNELSARPLDAADERAVLAVFENNISGSFTNLAQLEDTLGVHLLWSEKLNLGTVYTDGVPSPAEIWWSASGTPADGYLVNSNTFAVQPLEYVDQTYLSHPSNDAVLFYNAWFQVGEQAPQLEHSSFTNLSFTLYKTHYISALDTTAEIAYASNHTSAVAYFTAGGIHYELDVSVPHIHASRRVTLAEDLICEILDDLR